MVKNATTTMTSHLKAVKKTKLHEQIVSQIQSLIDKGRLKHGDQLPPERELAKIFKVSRHSLREAIRILEHKKVLKSRHADSQSTQRNRLSIHGHQEIVKAIQDAKPKAARDLMASHLSTIREFVLSPNDNHEG